MALCHKWDVKNDFAYVLQFFSLISDGLGGVSTVFQHIVTLLSLAKSRHGLACPELKQVNFPVEIAFAIVGLIWEAL